MAVYTITINSQGGTLTGPETVELDTASPVMLEAPGVSRSSFELLGWSTTPTGEEFLTFPHEFSGDDTIYAIWVYTIRFKKNDGSSSEDYVGTINPYSRPSLTSYLSQPTGALPVELIFHDINSGFSRTGYTLNGWSYEPSGTRIALFNTTSDTASYVVYALWWSSAFYDAVDESPTAPPKMTQDEENKLVNKALSALQSPYLSGMKLEADISIGGLTLNTIDSNGVVWVCTDLEGWWTIPDNELPDLPRGWGDGSYDSRGRYASRMISLNGAFLTQDPSQVPAARDKLVEAIDLVYSGGELIVHEDPAKTSFVRLMGKPLIDTVTARGRTEFSVMLKASDPIKYEYLTTGTNIEEGYRVEDLEGTNIPIDNFGNTRTPVILELTGPVPLGATVSNDINYISAGTDDVLETITVVKAIPSGSKLEIDTLNREAILVTGDEVENARSYISTLSSWFYIQPNSKATNNLKFTSLTGSCKIFYRSGWIA